MHFNILTPSSRGLSLALARQLLLRTPYPLIATCRDADVSRIHTRILSSLPATTTIPSSRLHVLQADVTDPSTLSRAAEEISRLYPPGSSAKYVFSTAGVLYPERSPGDLERDEIRHTLETNVLGPLLVLKHFSPFLDGGEGEDGGGVGGVWVNISARVGSISDNRAGGWYSYRASKAALNSITKTFDLHLQQKKRETKKKKGGAMAVAIHPGTVKTDLSREFWGSVPKGKLFEPEFAAEKILDVVMGLREEDRGLFWDWKGERIEW